MEHIFEISEEQAGKRIDALSASVLGEQCTRSKLQKYGTFFLKKSADFFETSAKTKVKEGETWKVVWPEQVEASDDLEPWDFPLTILAETSDYAVIEKPIGVTIHPSPTERSQQTIANALLHHFGKKLAENFMEIEGKKIARPGIVHRLDKGTSGALLIAKTDQSLAWFQSHWKEVEKVYYAVVSGVPPRSGKIMAGIERNPQDRQKMMASDSEKSKDAITFFEREQVSSDEKYSLLRVKIPTGRTHQIRVHLSSIGFPILGDDKYDGKKADRMYLHAFSLIFPEKDQKERKTVESVVPEEFFEICN